MPEVMIKYILFALYPVYSDSDKYLEKHLDKIGNEAGETIYSPNIKILCCSGVFHIYVSRIGQ